MIFSVHTISAKAILASCPFNKNVFAISYLAQFSGPIDAENVFGVWVCNLKSLQHSIIWHRAVLCKKQDGGWIKICEIFSGKSLKEELSIDTTFDPCYFLWDSPFNCATD